MFGRIIKIIFGLFSKPKVLRLYLDDDREAPLGWEVIRPHLIKDTLDAIIFSPPFRERVEAISFDHDLGENFPSGYELFCQLEKAYYEDGVVPPLMYVHSDNPPGRANLVRGINSLNRRIGRDYNPNILPR
jgi:hypothetical protein